MSEAQIDLIKSTPSSTSSKSFSITSNKLLGKQLILAKSIQMKEKNQTVRKQMQEEVKWAMVLCFYAFMLG